jgi:uncharacterized OB-fold protein
MIATKSIRTAGGVDTHQFAPSFYDLFGGRCDRRGYATLPVRAICRQANAHPDVRFPGCHDDDI